ncbi:TA system toxin CbtA family protein [Morganella morganii]|uniref:TA system toxin CbtA family protein n=1 Tax=Morganella morganii TaxID=582 RepID=UPI00052E05B1|nr:TA system toxin CbtA family protein [Morganella morganii]KGP41954.1 toxin YkfI [Morganella morganii]
MNNTAVPASPAKVWQTLLTYLLQQHYGLTLNDTEFSDERVIEACLCRGVSLCEALNAFAEKYALVRTDRRNNGITATDILRARKATGLITHHSSYATRKPVTV